MKTQTASPFHTLAPYYDYIYAFKDYEAEAKIILNLIHQYKKSSGNTLLDVACGTGKHLNTLKQSFLCLGTDLNEDMLTIARKNVPDVTFHSANMIDMRLQQTFDVITCLFSSIGYVKTYDNLYKTLETLTLHLKPGGMMIIEPWFSKVLYKVGYPHMTIYDGEQLKITRMDVSKVNGDLSILDFHYLIAEQNADVQYIKERHELAMFDIEKMLEDMRKRGLETHFLNQPPIGERGMLIGIKPNA